MNKKFSILATSILFASIFLPLFIQPVTATHQIGWTQEISLTLTGTGDTTTNLIAVNAIDNSKYAFGYVDASSNDYFVRQCNVGVSSCSVSTLDSASTSISHIRNHQVPNSTQMVTCWSAVRGGSSRALFSRSTDGGTTWTTATLLSNTSIADLGTDCMRLPNGNIVLVESHQGAGVVGTRWHESTNGGTTFTFKNTISTIKGRLGLAAYNNTHWTVWLQNVDVANELRKCDTTDSGTTWNCVVSGSASGDHNHVDTFTYEDHSVTLSNTGPTSQKTNDGETWTTLGPPANPVTVTRHYTNYGNQTIIRDFQTTGAGGTNSPCYSTKSTNGGGTWSTPIQIQTAVALFGNEGGVVGDTFPNGNGVALCTYRPSVGNTLVKIFLEGPLKHTIGAEFTTTDFTNLTAFDVDDTGNVVVIRETNGINIKTFNAINLETAAGPFDTGCTPPRNNNVFSQVTSIGVLIGFVTCDGLDPTHLFIRTGTLTSPPFDCPDDDCQDEIFLNGFKEAGGDNLDDLDEIAAFPLDHSFTKAGTIGQGTNKYLAWAFSSGGTSAGKVGIDMFSIYCKPFSCFPLPNPDKRNTVERQFGVSQVEDICTTTSGDKNYLTVGGLNSPTQVYEFIARFEGSPSTLNGDLVTRFVSTTQQNNAHGIDCQAGTIAISTQQGTGQVDHVYTIDWLNDTVIWGSPAINSSNPKMIALSKKFTHPVWNLPVQYVAYQNGGFVEIANALNGSVVGNLTIPSGTPKGIKMDFTAQNVWIATNTTISKYEVTNVTTINPVSPFSQIPIISPTPAQTGALPNLVESIQTGYGFDAVGSRIITGILLTILSALIGLIVDVAFTRNVRAGWGTLIGTVAGIALSWQVKVGGERLFPTEFVFVLAFILGMIVILVKLRS